MIAQLSIKVKGIRPSLAIFADADWTGNVRGYVSEELLDRALGMPDITTMEQLIGERACIQMVKDIGMDLAFTGITDMPYSKLSDNFGHYFHQSEQIPSYFWSLLLINEENEVVRSIGIAAQLLPGAPPSILRQIKEAVIERERQAPFCLNDDTIEVLPNLLFEDIEVMSTNTLQLFCECSKPVFYPMLYSLGITELKVACANRQSIEFVCHACGQAYSFSPEEIAGLV
ncbi:Hsp33 family molecular chaperone HslO [Paenibacillus sp. 1011MAR3C5]|uniref:Hsp33 family molecular chaperone HslO n=1 Tax=Paenibacillus sp. 1011MAR3C5 TaxID=1675787 RepID=UPI0011C43295|nr:Hsp33 family molecular chaperone HslO [Paenibacillus sp. 1011MAR3C5]